MFIDAAAHEFLDGHCKTTKALMKHQISNRPMLPRIAFSYLIIIASPIVSFSEISAILLSRLKGWPQFEWRGKRIYHETGVKVFQAFECYFSASFGVNWMRAMQSVLSLLDWIFFLL